MSLPDEIKLNILANIEIDGHNTHNILRQTHPWFRANISTIKLKEQMLAAEQSSKDRYLLKHQLICYTCIRVLPETQFADMSRKKGKGLGGVQASKRFCLSCGIRHAKYSPGSYVSVNNQPGVICFFCKRFVQGENIAPKRWFDVGAQGLCKKDAHRGNITRGRKRRYSYYAESSGGKAKLSDGFELADVCF